MGSSRAHLRVLLVAGIAAVAAVCVSAPVAAAAGPGNNSVLETGKRPAANAPVDLDVVARQVTLLHLSGRRYGIVMTGVSPKLVAMAEAPRRYAAYPPMELLGLWGRMFPGRQPNAIVMGRYDSATDAPVVVRMGKPTYDAPTRTLSFKGTLLAGSAHPPTTMDDVDLMIDPTRQQWIALGMTCGPAIISIIVAAISEGANIYADVASVTNSIACVSTVIAIFGK